MNKIVQKIKMNPKILLVLLWVFYTVNFMYCDSLSSLEPGVLQLHLTGYTADGTVKITEGFLLGTAIMFEIPFIMIILSWILNYRVNRLINIIAAALLIVAQIGSLFMGVPSPMYIFYSVIEITGLVFIIWKAWTWRDNEE